MTRIVFIDDDVLALQVMSKASSILGCQVILTTSPQQALALVAEAQPELVMVDLWMDEMDGPEFVRKMRLQPETAHLPVLIVSAGTGGADEETARTAGANGFMHKPLRLQDLSCAIHSYAARQ